VSGGFGLFWHQQSGDHLFAGGAHRALEGHDVLRSTQAEGRLVAHLKPLPFQEGRPLATAAEGSTELVDESSHELSSRQVLMAEEGEDDGDLPIIKFEAVSEDEFTVNAGDENDADREARRATNRARTIRRRRANERRRSMNRELALRSLP
jgi:hypothetical protein